MVKEPLWEVWAENSDNLTVKMPVQQAAARESSEREFCAKSISLAHKPESFYLVVFSFQGMSCGIK